MYSVKKKLKLKLSSISIETTLVAQVVMLTSLLVYMLIKHDEPDVYPLKDGILRIENQDRQGTAVYYKKGLVITASHLVNKGAKLYYGDYQLKYKIVARDESINIVILKVEDNNLNLKEARLRSKKIQQGELVFVIGNSYERNRYVSKGIISSVKFLKYVYGYTDAVTTPSGEGSAVFDRNGRLIGIIIHDIGGSAILLPLWELKVLSAEFKKYLK
jgi:S1-C subfamily serine protease